MKDKKLKKRAYSLPEILIALVIIAIIALLTVAIVPRKKMKEKEKPTHGTYACTYFDDVEYVFSDKKKDAPIPTTKDKWSQGKCGEGFILPTKAGILDIKAVGGGGSGGDAKGYWDKDFTPISTTSSSSYRIDGTGYYDITVYGGLGQVSSLSIWNASGGQCGAPIANPGKALKYKGLVLLNSGDMINIDFRDGGVASIFTSCGTAARPIAFRGFNGQNISVLRNNISILSVQGSGAGTYACSSTLPCTNRFKPVNGPDGIAYAANVVSMLEQKYNVGIDTRVDISWSAKNASTRVFKKIPGCGGMSGEINSTLYPILKNTLPKITIGKPGKPGTLATSTTFGALKANSGENNKVCNPTGNTNNGTAGISFDAIKGLVSKGGIAGISTTTSKINGGIASSFGSGGGGGAYYSASDPVYITGKTEDENNNKVLNGVTRWYEGTGGKGGAGLLVISW